MRKNSERFANPELARFIRIKLAEKDMNVSDLARRVNLDPRTLHATIYRANPKSPRWAIMAEALDVEIDIFARLLGTGVETLQSMHEEASAA